MSDAQENKAWAQLGWHFLGGIGLTVLGWRCTFCHLTLNRTRGQQLMGKGFWKPEQTACSLQGDKNKDHPFQTHTTTAFYNRAASPSRDCTNCCTAALFFFFPPLGSRWLKPASKRGLPTSHPRDQTRTEQKPSSPPRASRARAVTQLLLRREISFSLGTTKGSVGGAEQLVLAVI